MRHVIDEISFQIRQTFLKKHIPKCQIVYNEDDKNGEQGQKQGEFHFPHYHSRLMINTDVVIIIHSEII